MKLKCEAVHAVTQACRFRTILEDVTEMAAAAPAVELGPHHSEGAILGRADSIFEWPEEARPAGAALEFRFRGEQRQIAAGAGEDAPEMRLEQWTRVRTLGAFLAQDLILLRRQLGAPFGIGFLDFELLRGVCRGTSQPAQGRKAEQTSSRREQDTAVDHDSLRGEANCNSFAPNTRRWRGSYADPAGN